MTLTTLNRTLVLEPNEDRVAPMEEFASVARTPTRILIAGPERWWTASLVSLLGNRAFEVVTTTSSRVARRDAELLAPHAVIVHSRLSDGTGIDLVRKLRAEGFGEEYPIVFCSEEHLGREERLEVIRAGAWDFLYLPLGYDEFLLKLERFLGASRVARQAREEFIDPITGLYTLGGLLRCAQEMVSWAQRNHRPFGCVALAPTESAPSGRNSGLVRDSAPRIAALLTRQGRKSDVLGRIGPNEYVVLTPETGPAGVVTAATRFIRGMAAASTTSAGDAPLMFRAGCSAVSDLATQPVDPAEIITRATLALRHGLDTESKSGTLFVGAVRHPS